MGRVYDRPTVEYYIKVFAVPIRVSMIVCDSGFKKSCFNEMFS